MSNLLTSLQQIGVNVIPADTKNKKPTVEWLQYQDNPISEWQHEKWKSENAFSRGMAVIAGKVWHRQNKEGLLLDSFRCR